MASLGPIAGRHILLVEDDFFVADDFAAEFEAAGATVVGPAATLTKALDLIERTGHLDGAVLDIDLQGEAAYAVVDALRARAVPIVFVTGYDRSAIPERYDDVPLCEKPVDLEQVSRAMFG